MSCQTHHTDPHIKVIVISRNAKKVTYINAQNMGRLEAFLEKYSEEDEPIEWEVLAKERIEKYKKSGLVLRGMRYREGISQKDLAKKTGISQNEISKIENGKRTVGEKVAKRLAQALNTDYRLLISKTL